MQAHTSGKQYWSHVGFEQSNITSDQEDKEATLQKPSSIQKISNIVFKIGVQIGVLPRSRAVICSLMIVEYLQQASYLLHPQARFPWNHSINSWLKVIGHLRADTLVSSTTLHVSSLLFIVLLLFLIGGAVLNLSTSEYDNVPQTASTNNIVNNSSTFVSTRRTNSFFFKVLSIMALLMPSILFIPLSNIVLQSMSCKAPLVTEILGGCSSAGHLIWGVVAIFLALCLVVSTYMFQSLCYQCYPDSLNIDARRDAKYVATKLWEKLLIVLVFSLMYNGKEAIDDTQRWNLALILLVSSHYNAISLGSQMSYLSFGFQCMSGILATVRAWISQCIVLFLLVDMDTQTAGSTVLTYAATPLAVFATLALMQKRRAQIIMQSSSALSSPDEIELKARFRLHEMRETENIIKSNATSTRSTTETEEQITAIRGEAKNDIEQLLRDGLERFPNSIEMLCHAALYYSSNVLDSRGRAQATLLRSFGGSSSNCSVGSSSMLSQFQLFRAKRLIEIRERSLTDLGTLSRSESIQMKMELNKKCTKVNECIQQTIVEQYRFWAILLAEHVKVEILQNAGAEVVKKIMESQRLIELVCQINGNAVEVLRARGHFLVNVMGDVLAGTKLLEQADTAEQGHRADTLDAENYTGAANAANTMDSTDCFLIVSADTRTRGIVRQASDEALHLLGYKSSALVGFNISTILPHAIAKHHDHLVARFAKFGANQVLGINQDLFCVRGDTKDLIFVKVNLNVTLTPISSDNNLDVVATMWPQHQQAIACLLETKNAKLIHMTREFATTFITGANANDENHASAQNQLKGCVVIRTFVPDFDDIRNAAINAQKTGVSVKVIDANNEVRDAILVWKTLITQGLAVLRFDEMMSNDESDEGENSVSMMESESGFSSVVTTKSMLNNEATLSALVRKELAERHSNTNLRDKQSSELTKQEESSIISNYLTDEIASMTRKQIGASDSLSRFHRTHEPLSALVEQENSVATDSKIEENQDVNFHHDPLHKDAPTTSLYSNSNLKSSVVQQQSIEAQTESSNADSSKKEILISEETTLAGADDASRNTEGSIEHYNDAEDNDGISHSQSDIRSSLDSHESFRSQMSHEEAGAFIVDTTENWVPVRSSLLDAKRDNDAASSVGTGISGASGESLVVGIRRNMMMNHRFVERTIVLLVVVVVLSIVIVLIMSARNKMDINTLINLHENKVLSMRSAASLQMSVLNIGFIIDACVYANEGLRSIELTAPYLSTLPHVVEQFDNRFSDLLLQTHDEFTSTVSQSLESDLVAVMEENSYRRRITVLHALHTFITKVKRLQNLNDITANHIDVMFVRTNLHVLVAALDHISRLYRLGINLALQRVVYLEFLFALGVSITLLLLNATILYRLHKVFHTKREVLSMFIKIPRSSVASMLNQCRTALPETDEISLELLQSTQQAANSLLGVSKIDANTYHSIDAPSCRNIKRDDKHRWCSTPIVVTFGKLSVFTLLASIYTLVALLMENMMVQQSQLFSDEIFMSTQRHFHIWSTLFHVQQSTAASNMSVEDVTNSTSTALNSLELFRTRNHELLFGGDHFTVSEQMRVETIPSLSDNDFHRSTTVQYVDEIMQGSIKRMSSRELLFLSNENCKLSLLHSVWNSYGPSDTSSTQQCEQFERGIFTKGTLRVCIVFESIVHHFMNRLIQSPLPRHTNLTKNLFTDNDFVMMESVGTTGLRYALNAATELYHIEQNKSLGQIKAYINFTFFSFVVLTALLAVGVLLPVLSNLNRDIARVRFMLMLVPLNVLKEIEGIRKFLSAFS